METIDTGAPDRGSFAEAPAQAGGETLHTPSIAQPRCSDDDVQVYEAAAQQQASEHEAAATTATPFDPIEALKLGSQRLANLVKRNPEQQQQQKQAEAEKTAEFPGDEQQGTNEVVARIRATAAGLGARVQQQSSRFYQASVKTAATTAEGIKRLAQGEPLQAVCRSELAGRPCPQLVMVCCTALVSGQGLTTERILKHDPPQELVDRLAATAAGPLSLLPPGASPHAIAALLKQFLLGLPEPLLTYRLLPQWVAAGDHPKSCTSLLQQLPAANAGALRLIMQTCSYINEQAAVNEMDSQALAEVLAHVVAWKPAPKPERSTGQGPWQGLTKALTLHRGAAAAGDSGTTPPVEAGDAAGAAEGAQESVATLSLSDAAADVQRVTPLDDAELEAIVTVLEYVISNFGTVFGAFT